MTKLPWLINFFGGTLRFAVNFLSLRYLLIILGDSLYGSWVLLMSLASILTILDFGIPPAITVFVSKALVRKDTDELSQIVGSSFTALVIVACGAGALGYFLPEIIYHILTTPLTVSTTESRAAFNLLCLAVVFKFLLQGTLAVIQGFNRWGLSNAIELSLMSGILFSWWLLSSRKVPLSTLALLQASLTATAWFVALLFTLYLLKTVKAAIVFEVSTFKRILLHGLGCWIGSLSGGLFAFGDKLIVGYMLGPANLAIYSLIMSLVAPINAISALPAQSLLSFAHTSTSKIENYPHLTVKICTAVSVAIASELSLLISLFGPDIFKFLFMRILHYEETVSLVMASLIYLFYAPNAVGYIITLTNGYTRTLLVFHFLLSLAVPVTVVFLSPLGLIGAIMANFWYIGVIIFTFNASKIIKISANDLIALWRNPLILAIMAGIVGLLPEVSFITKVIIFCILSLTQLYLLNHALGFFNTLREWRRKS